MSQNPQPTDSVPDLIREFLHQVDARQSPQVEAFLDRLSTQEQKDRFLAAVEPRSKRRFSTRARPGLCVGARYRLIEEIGAGGMGQVWRAHDEQIDTHVAVKILTVEHADRLDNRERIERESRAMARIEHPGIAALRDSGIDGELSFLVMDFVEGLPLSEVVRRLRALGRDPATLRVDDLLSIVGPPRPGRTSPLQDEASHTEVAARLLVEILRILEAAHAAGVVHRDIKPSNLLLRPGAEPVILDFGIAGMIAAEPGDMTQALVGSPTYLAPEQIQRGRTGATPQSDLYQCGLVLYELLTLQHAFDPTDDTVVQKIRNAEFRSPTEIVPTLDVRIADICEAALAPLDGGRYSSATAFRTDLERFLGGTELPEASRRPGKRRRAQITRSFARRHRFVLAVAGALVVGFALALLFFGRGAVRARDGVLGRDGIVTLTASARADGRAYAFLVMQADSDADADRVYLPLEAVEGSDEPGVRLGGSERVLRFRVPADTTERARDLGLKAREGILLFSSSERAQRAYARLRDDMAEHLDETGDVGIRSTDLRRVFRGATDAARAAGDGGTAEISVEDFLSGTTLDRGTSGQAVFRVTSR